MMRAVEDEEECPIFWKGNFCVLVLDSAHLKAEISSCKGCDDSGKDQDLEGSPIFW